MRHLLWLFLGIVFISAGSQTSFAATHNIKMRSVLIDGVKFWIPSNIFAKKGDTVKIQLVNKVPGNGSEHGFSIKQFNVREKVKGKMKTVEFVADKAGIFPMYCHMHAGHVGGQLVVLD